MRKYKEEEEAEDLRKEKMRLNIEETKKKKRRN